MEYQIYFTPRNDDLIVLNRQYRLNFLLNDYDLADEYLDIYDYHNLSIRCNGGVQAPIGCNSSSQCFNRLFYWMEYDTTRLCI